MRRSDTDANGGASNRFTRRRFIAATGATSVLALAGCSGGDGGDGSDGGSDGGSGGGDGSDGGDGGSSSDGGSAPPKPDKLIVRAWGGSWQGSLKKYVAEPFTEETGIAVEFDNTSEEKMQGKIRTALRQDRKPPVNVNWSTSLQSYVSAQAELMKPLDPDVVPNLKNLLAAGKPETGSSDWPFVNLYSYVYSLSYNTNKVSSEPTSWEQFWDDKWSNGIGLYTGGTGFVPVLAKLTGEKLDDSMSKTWDRLRDLKPNVGVVADDTQITQNLRNGEIAMATLIASNTYNAKNDGAPVDYTVPDEGAVAKRDAMWIPKKQDEKYTYWGQKFINAAASAKNLGPWAEGLGVAPLHPDAEVPGWMEDAKVFPTSKAQFNSMITVDPGNYVENSSYWSSNFNQITQA